MKEQNYLAHMIGCFGDPVSENPGVVIQDAAFKDLGLNYWYFLTIEVAKQDLGAAVDALKTFKMRGANCTIPHKIAVIPYLDELSESAKLIGAVNTIVNNDGKLYGDNTDGKGFMESLRERGMDPKGKKMVILGAGGAARAVCVEMSLAGVGHITIVNRPEDKHLGDALVDLLTKMNVAVDYVDWVEKYSVPADTEILINATPIGLYPNVDAIPNIDVDTILPSMFVQDVIPNPAVTPFLRAAEARGAKWNTGMGMLVNQAAINVEMWTGKMPNKEVMIKALQEALE